MAKYEISYIKNEGSFWRLCLSPMDAEDAFDYSPGQYAALSIESDAGWSPVRCLSFTSTPSQGGQLEFGFKVTGNFTRGLASARPGTRVNVQGPFGDFTLPSWDPRPAVLIAGGIGITPFVSMLRDADSSKDRRGLTLLQAGYQADSLPFAQELSEIGSRHSHIRTYRFAQQGANAQNRYIAGKISQTHLATLIDNKPEAFLFYLCGPEQMMRSTAKTLRRLGVEPADIITESFSSSSKTAHSLFGFSLTRSVYGLSAAVMALFVVIFGAIGVKAALAKLPASSGSQSTVSNSSSSDSTSNASMPTPTPTDSPTSPSSSSSTPSYSDSYYQQPVTQVS